MAWSHFILSTIWIICYFANESFFYVGNLSTPTDEDDFYVSYSIWEFLHIIATERNSVIDHMVKEGWKNKSQYVP